jgi:hypothetical protein
MSNGSRLGQYCPRFDAEGGFPMSSHDDWRDAPPNEQYACNAIADHGRARRLASEILSPECFSHPVLRIACKCLLVLEVDARSRRILEGVDFSWQELRLGFRWQREDWAVEAIRTLVRADDALLIAPTLRWAADAIGHEHPLTVLRAITEVFALAGWPEGRLVDAAA